MKMENICTKIAPECLELDTILLFGQILAAQQLFFEVLITYSIFMLLIFEKNVTSIIHNPKLRNQTCLLQYRAVHLVVDIILSTSN